MLLDKMLPRGNWWQSKKRREHDTGDIKIRQYSSLRKLARAMRRGKVPDERQVLIDNAMASAQKRWLKYLNKGARAQYLRP